MIVQTSRFFPSANSTGYLVSTIDGTMPLKEPNSTEVRLLSTRFHALAIITSFALTSGPSKVLSVHESHNLHDSNSRKGVDNTEAIAKRFVAWRYARVLFHWTVSGFIMWWGMQWVYWCGLGVTYCAWRSGSGCSVCSDTVCWVVRGTVEMVSVEIGFGVGCGGASWRGPFVEGVELEVGGTCTREEWVVGFKCARGVGVGVVVWGCRGVEGVFFGWLVWDGDGGVVVGWEVQLGGRVGGAGGVDGWWGVGYGLSVMEGDAVVGGCVVGLGCEVRGAGGVGCCEGVGVVGRFAGGWTVWAGTEWVRGAVGVWWVLVGLVCGFVVGSSVEVGRVVMPGGGGGGWVSGCWVGVWGEGLGWWGGGWAWGGLWG
ncbi:hypothetical protein Tco_1253375 [Tanacetum coccineum]